MSIFDDMFDSAAASVLMAHFSDERTVSIQLGGKWLVRDASCVVRPEGTSEVYQGDQIVKQVEMEIDLLRDQVGLPDKGLERNTIGAIAIVNGVRWNVDGMLNRTSTYVTLKLVRRTMREKSASGFRRQEA